MGSAVGGRTFTASRADLLFGKKDVGALQSVEGGWVSAAVVVSPPAAPPYYGKKHLANARYDDIELELPLGMDPLVYDWINDTWGGLHPRKTGAIQLADGSNTVQRERAFQNALITETTIPACDASSKDLGAITVKLAPEIVRQTKGGGEKLGTAPKQTRWLLSSFRFAIDGLDATKVVAVGPFTVKQVAQDSSFGETREALLTTKLDFGPLPVTIVESAAATWEAWADDFIVNGNNSDPHEKSAVLGLMAADLKTYLAHVDFFNVGIFRYEDAPVGMDKEGAKHVIAHLYCERAEFHLGAPLPVVCPNCAFGGPPAGP